MSKDNTVRLVRIRTGKCIIERAIHQVYPTKLYRDSKTTNNTQDDKTFNDFAEEFQPIRSAAAVAKHRIKDIANNENQ